MAQRKRRISNETAKVLALFLAEPEKPRYGREIVAETALKSGSLYPMLHRLEGREILESGWEDLQAAVDQGRRPRRLYRLCGVEEAEQLMADWRAGQRPARSSFVGRELPA